MITITGTIRYDNNYKLYVEIGNDISKYYLKMIPKYVAIPNPQRYDAHISVVRNETPEKLEYWKKYDGYTIQVEYDPYIKTDGVYFWLNVYTEELSRIREELGLSKTSELSRPPSGEECFHITIGNLKN